MNEHRDRALCVRWRSQRRSRFPSPANAGEAFSSSSAGPLFWQREVRHGNCLHFLPLSVSLTKRSFLFLLSSFCYSFGFACLLLLSPLPLFIGLARACQHSFRPLLSLPLPFTKHRKSPSSALAFFFLFFFSSLKRGRSVVATPLLSLFRSHTRTHAEGRSISTTCRFGIAHAGRSPGQQR